MDEREVALLKSDLLKSYQVIERIYKRILNQQATFRDSPPNLDSMAYQLHNLYGAYEELFAIVAEFFENQIQSKRYHIDLLHRMETEISGVRPALISEPARKLLQELQRFYHFFRHAYGEELDPDRVNRIVQIAIQLKELFRQDMELFLRRLK